MRAVRFHEYGGTDVLRVDDIERPTPGPEEVLLEVEAAAVNPVDTYFRTGDYEPGELPWIPGSDCAGTVAATGERVASVTEGDRAFATGLGNWLQGTCAEYVTVPESHLAKLPDGVSAEAGAAVEKFVVACPMCMTMYEDGRKTGGYEDDLEIVGVTELLAEAVSES